jgi:hypothetical protein
VSLISVASWLNEVILAVFLIGLIVAALGARRVRSLVPVARSRDEAA